MFYYVVKLTNLKE